ncbi:hypothetical protein NVV94_13000 [Pseudomonas sp. LS1212]|uniref:hypothetical protein n=1 Tax=Pseudomonas sp. LS1212 TaxID=2972478 RepID=UPI00215C4E7F|nr:hypothetical protein [Pseudomonas sp. LS1212]UVJ46361.1 hypothetical protein NVV94_13000 [Pseudomonas sp. LS1212]
MHVVMDRPLPVDYVHPSGEQAKIDFIWGEPNNAVPVVISIWLKTGETYVKLGMESDTWNTFGEARQRGIELATKWLERGN